MSCRRRVQKWYRVYVLPFFQAALHEGQTKFEEKVDSDIRPKQTQLVDRKINSLLQFIISFLCKFLQRSPQLQI